MTYEAEVLPTAGHPRVLLTDARGIQRGDQVTFASPEGEEGTDVAGGVSGVHHGPDPSTVTLVVANRVHFVPVDHRVIVIRRAEQARQGELHRRWSRAG